MKRLSLLLGFFLLAWTCSFAQSKTTPEPDAATIYKDTSGNIIEKEEFYKIRKAGHGTIWQKPVIENDRVKETRLVVLTPEEQKEQMTQMTQMMKESTKNLNAMKGKKAPDFEGMDLNDNKVKLSDFKGKVVVLKFWFTRCQPCLMEMPALNKMIEEKYKDRNDVVFVSLCLDDKDEVKKTLEKHPFLYRTLYNMRGVAMDTYRIFAYPTHFVIDKNQVVTLTSNVGSTPLLEQAINKALAEK